MKKIILAVSIALLTACESPLSSISSDGIASRYTHIHKYDYSYSQEGDRTETHFVNGLRVRMVEIIAGTREDSTVYTYTPILDDERCFTRHFKHYQAGYVSVNDTIVEWANVPQREWVTIADSSRAYMFK